VAEVVGSLLLGGLLLAITAGFYFLVLATGCFTSDYGRPVFKKLKPRLFVANLVLMALLLFGLGLTLAGVFQIAFRLLGVGWSGFLTGMIVAALVVNVGMVRFSVWAPFEPKLAARRLLASGVPAAELARGICIGISDPAVSGWKKAILEDDIGFLWLEPDRLVYRGDGDAFEIARGSLLAVERVVLSASTTAYSGNRHIVLRFRTDAGGERRTCLHPEGLWTPGRVVSATDALAARLHAWDRRRS
jgi:hypothetical protein